MFFAYILTQMRFQDVSYTTKYPHPINSHSVRASTAILLHWDAWVHDAPPSWKQDGFLTQNSPVALTVRYGQNQPVCHSNRPENLQQESNSWERDRDYAHIRTIAFSIAHHITFRDVREWENLSGLALQNFHGDLYDLPADNPARVLINLPAQEAAAIAEADMQEEVAHIHHEIPVYTRDGFHVRRRIPTLDGYDESGGLVDLTKVDTLFPPDENGKNTYHAYPLGFTKSYGNVQANRTITLFDKALQEINTVLTPSILDEEDVGDGDNDADHDIHCDGLRRLASPVLYGTYCQIYNAIAHRVREQARFHYVQLGLATSVLPGTMVNTQTTRRRFERRKTHCDHVLPHQRYAEAVIGDGQPQALRIEQTFVMDVYRLRARQEWKMDGILSLTGTGTGTGTGRMIYEEIIAKLCKQTIHPRALNPILNCVKAFKPEVIPNLLNWTTYPLTLLIELVWNQEKRSRICL
ncbi:hypothetical protein JVU11DRAFT_9302 [Chiua virens]|nr:hypothetical protein JVU11DRAFT_9302 [Chiua virens]